MQKKKKIRQTQIMGHSVGYFNSPSQDPQGHDHQRRTEKLLQTTGALSYMSMCELNTVWNLGLEPGTGK